jgi:hypothetical protein
MSRHLLKLPISVENILKYDETLQESTLDLKPTIADVVVLMTLFQNQRARVVETILKFTVRPALTCNKRGANGRINSIMESIRKQFNRNPLSSFCPEM